MYMKCPLCGSENEVFRLYRTLDFFLTREEFEIWECNLCNIRYTHPFPPEIELPKYYKSPEYLSHAKTHQSVFSLIYGSIRSLNVKWKAQQLKRFFPQPGSILDVGCGSGSFLAEMKRKGWACVGIEPDFGSRSFVENHWNIPVYKDIASIEKNQSFQVITLWHVLEHFSDPFSALKQLKMLLNNDGILVVAVPNFESLDAMNFGSYWAAYDVPRHLYHFSLASLESVIAEAGFKIVQVKPVWVDVFYISYLSYRYLGKRLALLKGFFKSIEFLLRSNKVTDYSSIVIFARKKTE